MTGQKRLSTYWPNRFIFSSQFLLLPFAIILLIFPIANAEVCFCIINTNELIFGYLFRNSKIFLFPNDSDFFL